MEKHALNGAKMVPLKEQKHRRLTLARSTRIDEVNTVSAMFSIAA